MSKVVVNNLISDRFTICFFTRKLRAIHIKLQRKLLKKHKRIWLIFKIEYCDCDQVGDHVTRAVVKDIVCTANRNYKEEEKAMSMLSSVI